MLLTGKFDRTVDEKLRLALPKAMRDALGETDAVVLYVAPGTDGSLGLYTENSLSHLADRLESVSPNAEDVRRFSRLFFARTQRVEMDKAGRIRIPAELAELGGIGRSVVLVGVRDHIELWDKDRWSAYLQKSESDYDVVAEKAFDPHAALRSAAEIAGPGRPLPR